FIGMPVRDYDGVTASVRAASVVDRLRHECSLIGRTGAGLSVLKIRPPLVFGQSDTIELGAMLNTALTDA
ncbi:MAG: aspartate aminotransferase family protein, partial [Acidimicrobiia bacterium]|nr:aspartate aminotransferase family protein [Acidimicrobiia bacterium]